MALNRAGLSKKARRRIKSRGHRPPSARRLHSERLETRALLAGDLGMGAEAPFSEDLQAEGEGEVVRFRLETTDTDGVPLSSVLVGEEFDLRVYTKDLRPQGAGVFAAYLDVLYSNALVSVTGPLEESAIYDNGVSGNTSIAGIVDEAGGFSAPSPLGPAEQLVFTIPFIATSSGQAQFTADPAEVEPFHNVLIFGENLQVPDADIDYGAASLQITDGGLPFFEDFNDGAAEGFTVNSGAFNIVGDRYMAQPPVGVDAISTVNLNESLPAEFAVEAVLNASPGGGGFWSNGFVIFDYVSPTNFKYAGTFVGRGTWAIGQRTAGGFFDLAVQNDTISTNQDYDLRLDFDGNDVTLSVDGVVKTTHTFSDSPADGKVGVATQNALAKFDDVRIFVPGAEPPPLAVDDVAGTGRDTPIDIFVLDNDFGGGIIIIAVSDPLNGGVVFDNASGTVTYSPDPLFTGTDTFTYTITDEDETGTSTADVTVFVSSENSPPTAIDDDVLTTEDHQISIDVATNDFDIDDNPLTVANFTQGENGAVINAGNNNLIYQPVPNFNGTDSFTYTITDGFGGTDTATVTITIEPDNDSPTALDDISGADVDTPVDINVLANDFDIDGDEISIASFGLATHGDVVDLGGGVLRYTPDEGFIGVDSFTYSIEDEDAAIDFAEVTVTIGGPDLAVFRLETTNLAGNPISELNVGDDFLLNVFIEDVSAIGDGAFAAYLDVFYDESILSVAGPITPGEDFDNLLNGIPGDVSNPGIIDEAGGFGGIELTGPGEHLVFSVPMRADAAGQTTILGDPADVLPSHHVLLFNHVDPVSPAQILFGTTELLVAPPIEPESGLPFFEDFNDGTAEDFNVNSGAFNVAANRYMAQPPVGVDAISTIDLGEPLPDEFIIDAVLNASPGGGGFWSNAFIIFDYISPTNFKYAGTFVGRGTWALGQRTVTGFIDAAAANDTISTNQDYDLSIEVDGNSVTLSVDGVTKVSHTFGDSPANGAVGVATQNALAKFDDISIEAPEVVPEVQTPPVAVNDSANTTEGVPAIINVVSNDQQTNGDAFNVTAVTQGANGGVVNNNNGTVTYTPGAAFTGSDTFTYTIADNDGTDTATVTVNVAPASSGGLPFFENFNDGTADDFTVNSGAFSVVTNRYMAQPTVGANAVSTIDPGEPLPGEFTIDAVLNATQGAAGYWSNAFIIFDYVSPTNFKYAGTFVGRGTWALGQRTATGFIDAAAANDTISTNQDYDLSIEVDGNSVTLSVDGVTKVSHTFADSAANGAVGVATQNALAKFDDISITAPATAEVPPVAVNDSANTTEGVPAIINVVSNDQQTNGDAFNVTAVTQGANGGVVNNNNGTVTYTPGAAFTGSDTFTYTIADNDGTDTATVTVNVAPVSTSGLPFFEDFNDGVADDFTVNSGAFSVVANRYMAQPPVGADAVSTIDPGEPLPSEFTIDAVLNASPGGGGFWSNAFIIFDYISPTNFKYAGTFVGRGTWALGQRTATGFIDAIAVNDTISTNQDYDLNIEVSGNSVTLSVDGVTKASHTFADSAANGAVGVATQNAQAKFDDIHIQAVDEIMGEFGG